MGWVERESYEGRKAEFGHIKSKTDAHGWRVCACIKVDYDARPLPWVEVWREDTTGREFDRQQHLLPLQPDSLEMMIGGSNVHLLAGVHTETVNNRRVAKRLELVIPNWYTPWPEQGEGGEREGAATYIPQEIDTGGATREDVQQIINTFAATLPAMMRRAVEDVLAAKGVLTETMVAAGGSFRIWEQLVNTSYSGAVSALDDWDGLPPGEFAEKAKSIKARLTQGQEDNG